MKTRIHLLLILCVSFLSISCSNDDDGITPVQLSNIVEAAQGTADLSSLVAALIQADAGLVELLQTDGPFTVFAPTNQAFADLLDALGDDYNSLADFDTADEKMLLADILKYHVISGVGALSTSLSNGQTIETALAGASVTISIDGANVFIQDATDTDAGVVAADGIASNGVIHVIDKVLLPESVVNGLRPNIVELAQSVGDLSLLVDALIQADAGLVDLLQTDGPFTVFAPTNQAFADLLDTLGDDYNSLADFDTADEKVLLADILKYHVVAGTAAYSTDLSEGQMIETAQGESITVSLTGGVFIDDAEVTGADNNAKNGVVHIINKIILPQSVVDALTPNIVELAQSVGDLSLLVDALIQADAGLVDLLQTDGPFTVFAPTNQAFADLLDTLGDDYNSLADFDTVDEKALLADILKYHVVAGTAAYSTDLSEGQMIETAQGESITVSLTGGVFIQDATDTDAEVTGADNAAKNGVVHIINKIILPQAVVDALTPDIVGLAQSVSDLSLLVDALIQADAGLVELLQTDGPFTVFAPTNQAFADLLDTLGDDYNSLADFDTVDEKALLADILKYHVVAGTAAYSTDLSEGQMIETAQGESITVSLTGGVFIQDATDTDAEVTGADNAAKNGVVHIINKIILPQAVVDALTPDIVGLAQSVGDLSLLVDALIQADAGLVELLQTDGPFTVFAPTNQAFTDLLDTLGSDYNSLADFDTAAEKTLLADILKYHVISGTAAYSTDLSEGQMIETAQGESVTVSLTGGVFIQDATATDAEVTGADNAAKNGVVHIINKIILPQAVVDAL